MRKLLFLAVIFFNINEPFAQLSKQDYIITTEQYSDGTKRREIYYTKDFKRVAETYFYNNKKFASIRYNKNNEKEIEMVEEYDKNAQDYVLTRVDFGKGVYEEPNNDLRLSFKGRFVFDGKQEDFICDIMYKNGIKCGKFNQRSINVRCDEFGGKTSWQYEMEEKANRLSQSHRRDFFYELTLNFDNNVLNGFQTLLTNSNGLSIVGLFNYGKVLNYQSSLRDNQTNTNKIISVIKTDKQIIFSPQILNGSLWQPDGNYILYFQNLSQAGNIVNSVLDKEYFEYEERPSDFGEYSFEFNVQAKRNADSLKVEIENFDQLRRLIGIPKFKILKYSLKNNDEIEIVKIKLDNCNIDTTQNKIELAENKFKNGISFLLPPFKKHPFLLSDFNASRYATKKNEASFINWLRTSYKLPFNIIDDKYHISKEDEEEVENNLQESISNLFQKKTIKQFRRIGASNTSSFLFFQRTDTLELIYNDNSFGDDYDRTKHQYFCKLKKLNSIADYYSYNYNNKSFYSDKQLDIDSNLNDDLVRNAFLFYPGTLKESKIATNDSSNFDIVIFGNDPKNIGNFPIEFDADNKCIYSCFNTYNSPPVFTIKLIGFNKKVDVRIINNSVTQMLKQDVTVDGLASLGFTIKKTYSLKSPFIIDIIENGKVIISKKIILSDYSELLK